MLSGDSSPSTLEKLKTGARSGVHLEGSREAAIKQRLGCGLNLDRVTITPRGSSPLEEMMSSYTLLWGMYS